MHAERKVHEERSGQDASIRLAIVEARSGESNEEAWRRHLTHHPQDQMANVKIFNRGGKLRSQG
jgi:hypothetical protein